tara:strand:+ start:1911 stop:5258 length:3348 start_codon:yes stop_codon:yes gene_type:complete
MNSLELIKFYDKDSYIQSLCSWLSDSKIKQKALKGLVGGLKYLVPSVLFSRLNNNFCFVVENKEVAFSFYYNLKKILHKKNVFLFPSLGYKYYGSEKVENSNVVLRGEVLSLIQEREREKKIIITYPEAIFERVVGKTQLSSQTLNLALGDEISYLELESKLISFGFEQSDFIEEVGQYSIRGQVFDLYSFAYSLPFRITFNENKITKISTFDIETQLSVERKNQITILTNPSSINKNSENVSLFEYLDESFIVWVQSKKDCALKIESLYGKTKEAYAGLSSKTDIVLSSPPEKLFINKKVFNGCLDKFISVDFGVFKTKKSVDVFEYKSRSQPDFNKNLNLLEKDLETLTYKNYSIVIGFQSEEQVERINVYFKSKNNNIQFASSVLVLSEGFVDDNTKLVYYTDHQIFNRYFKFKTPLVPGIKKRKLKHLTDHNKLNIGDYLVHIDYGIGRFLGLEKLKVKNTLQEVIKVSYQNNDLVYVGINSLHKISKYVGGSLNPVLDKLGSSDWIKKKSKVQSKIKDIANDLISLYAKRKESVGFSFLSDDYLQSELESSFLFQDTPDQSTSLKEIKKDMESEQPMDRLVCGDVGFGKTEVAVRAAFKAVCNNKQVLVLVPTTILAFQHYNTFNNRLKNFPVNVDYVSRFRKGKDLKNILENSKKGKIDILIGTQKAVGKSFKFKDLGLLIVDEEQKFGVAIKEKIKKQKVFVDTLTLTATPIPRTLHFSLIGIRDISVIETAPPNRIPIETEIISFDKKIIRDVIKKELDRFGQVFFVNNRVHNIYQIADVIQKLVPDAKIGVAHGQLPGDRLEKVMLRFIEGYFDVLVSTNIIESGLDVANANTVIINDAHNFGLSDLHQIRGRVGRSNINAYCYLITKSLNRLSNDARKRLTAISELSQLGDGFKIALKDLDIRGAGDLLGGEQSGFINDLGFDMYNKILDEAVQEIKKKEGLEPLSSFKPLINYDCLVEIDKKVFIPASYIDSHNERLSVYSKIDKAKKKIDYRKIKHDLVDRFGPLPSIIKELIIIKKLKKHGFMLGFKKIKIRENSMFCDFKEKKGDKYYTSKAFDFFLKYLKENKNKSSLNISKNNLQISFNDIFSTKDAFFLLKYFSKNIQ